jgi:hypothetical protein
MRSRKPVAAFVAVAMLASVSACGGNNPKSSTQLKFVTAAAAELAAGSTADVRIATNYPTAVVSDSGKSPVGLSFRPEARGSAELVGRLGAYSGGRYTLDLTARDGSRRVSQHLALTVEQAPAFLSGDAKSLVVWTARTNQIPILATGYPAPTISKLGQLQSGVSFRPILGGAALITGSPGYWESPCSSEVTLRASNSVGSATLNLTVSLKNLRCAISLSTALHLLQGAFRMGPNIIKGGKVVGQWVVQSGQKVGQFFNRGGQEVADVSDQAINECAEEDCESGD